MNGLKRTISYIGTPGFALSASMPSMMAPEGQEGVCLDLLEEFCLAHSPMLVRSRADGIGGAAALICAGSIFVRFASCGV